jgi:hypothetical protein
MVQNKNLQSRGRMSRTSRCVRFDQAEGFTEVRVFDKPDRPTARIIGTVKTGSCGLVIQEDVNSFHKVCQDGLEGWVGVKNVIFEDDLSEGRPSTCSITSM